MSLPVLFLDTAHCFGGAQRSLAELILALDPQRISPVVLTADDGPEGLAAHLAERPVPCAHLEVHPWQRSMRGCLQAGSDLWHVRGFVREQCARHRARVLYANGWQAGLICAADGPRGVPFVLHHRDYLVPPTVLRLVVHRAARTVVVSDFVREQVLAMLGHADQERVLTIHNGVDPGALAVEAAELDFRNHFQYPLDRPLVLLAADFVPWKRHDLFLDALAIVAKARPNVLALLVGGTRDAVGEAWERELVTRVERMGLYPNVLFTGWVDNPYPLMAAADTVVSVAEDEPFGRTVAEALALGRPVTAVRGGGPAEIVHDSPAAVLVDATPEAIAAGMMRWLAPDLDRETVSRQARATAAAYDLKQHAQQVMALLEAVAQAA